MTNNINNINNDDNGSMESKKTFAKKLHLNKETINETINKLNDDDRKWIPGGAAASERPDFTVNCIAPGYPCWIVYTI